MRIRDAVTTALLICMWTAVFAEVSRDDFLLHGKPRRIRRNSHRAGRPKRGATGSLTPITLAVILPTAEPFVFRKQLVLPAINHAVESVKSEMASMGYTFQVTYRDSFCGRRAALAAVDLYYGDDAMYNRSTKGNSKKDVGDTFLKRKYDGGSKRRRRAADDKQYSGDWPSSNDEARNRDLPIVFIGPACNEAASIVSAFAENWNAPLITSGAPAAWITPGPDYPTLTRVGSSHFDLAYFVDSVFDSLEYGTKVPVHLLYEDVLHGETAERECHYVMQAVYHVLNRNPDVQLFGPTYVIGTEFDDNRIASDMGDPKVVLMCATSEVVRRIMVGACKTGYANPKKHVWYAIDLHNSTQYAHGAWRRGDENDIIAKEAYKALQIISVYSRNNLRFNNFVMKMEKEYRKTGVSYRDGVNEFVVGFHDAILLYTYAVRRTLQQGIDIRDGRAVTRNMRNTTINGIAGPVVIGETGDRHGDYSILAMTDPRAGTFSSVYDYLGTFEEVHNHGMPRLDLTSFRNERNYSTKESGVSVREILAEAEREKAARLATSTTQHEILAGILGTFGGMTLCCALIFGPMCYQRRHRSRGTMSENGNGFGQFLNGNSDQVCLHRPLREEGSVATCTTSLEDDQKL